LNRQADGGRGAGVFAALHFAAELFAKHSGDERQFAAASGDIQRFDVAAFGKLRGGLDRFGKQRAAALIKIGDRDGGLSHAFFHHVEIDDDLARVGMQCFLLATAFLIEAKNFGQAELRKSFFSDGHFG